MADSKRHLHRYDKPVPTHRPTTLSELAILQQRHQFIRDDEQESAGGVGKSNNDQRDSWEDRLARSWYDKLFREYAVCDLTQYKTGGIALRWRTEEEVLDRKGELTCASLHCKHHAPTMLPSERNNDDEDSLEPLVKKSLTPYQLNFAYVEHGKAKNALVKVVLCDRCARKLTWKKDRDRQRAREELEQRQQSTDAHAHAESEAAETSRRPGDDREGEKTSRDEAARKKARRL